MGLGRQLAQGRLRMLDGITLGTEGGVAQPRPTTFGIAIALPVGRPCATTRTRSRA